MKVMSPVYNYESACAQIEAGADEIYLGLVTPSMKNISFTGRAKSANIQSVEELQKIVKKSHENNVKVNFTANAPHIGSSLKDLYMDMIYQAIDAGVDMLIIGALEGFLMMKENGIDMPLGAGTFLDTFNIEQIKLLESLGASRIILPYDITMSEIKELCKISNAEIEVFGQFGCSNTNGTCLLIHSFGEKIDLGLPCKAKYNVLTQEGIELTQYPFMAAGLECSICSLKDLIDAGVSTIKLLDRTLPHTFTSQLTKVYKEIISMLLQGKMEEEPVNYVISQIFWWEIFCKNNKCKYFQKSGLNYYYI